MFRHRGVPVREWKSLGDAHVFNQANDQAAATETDAAPMLEDITVSAIIGKALVGNSPGLRGG